MPNTYHWMELELLYPENWRVQEDTEAGALFIESPSGTFLTITRPQKLQAAFDQARKAMEKEYDNVETENCSRLLGETLLEGIIKRFVYLDFIVTSHILKLESEQEDFVPMLIQIQGEDRDMDREQPVLDAILTSLVRDQQPLS